MIEKFKNFFRTIAIYLFWGLRSADKAAFGNKNELDSGWLPIERHDEQDSVYKDLLRGEVTQEVKELRHEMYYSERASHKYEYIGNGVARIKNDFFTYNGKIENSDGFEIQLLQPNIEDAGTLTDNINEDDYRLKEKKEYTLDVIRDYIPKLRIEEYTTKLVVKRINETAVMLDFYTPIYQKQFDKIHRVFLNELDRVYQGDVKSEIVDFNGVKFISFRAFGTDDLKLYEYNNIEFDNIVKFDGDYVLKFTADIVNDGKDLLDEIYDEKADEKFKNKAPREGKQTLDFSVELMKQSDTYNIDEAEKLFHEMKGQNNTAI